jgi:hypothetical protein
MLKALLAAALLAATTSLYAQAAPAPDADKAAQRKEARAKLKAAREQAGKACEGKQGDEHRACMGQQYCAKAQDPAQCQARLKERAEKRKQRRESQKK